MPVVLGIRPAKSWCQSGTRFQPRTGSLAGEMQRTGLKVSTGSKPALELAWWKRGNEIYLVTVKSKRSSNMNKKINDTFGKALKTGAGLGSVGRACYPLLTAVK